MQSHVVFWVDSDAGGHWTRDGIQMQVIVSVVGTELFRIVIQDIVKL